MWIMCKKISCRFTKDIKSNHIWSYNSYFLRKTTYNKNISTLFSLPNDELGFNIFSVYWFYKKNYGNVTFFKDVKLYYICG